MNQNIPGDPLDALLHRWADERAVGSDHLDNLQQRIVLTIDDETFSSTGSVADSASEDAAFENVATFSSKPVDTRRAPVASLLVGVTLTVLVAIAWFAQLTGQGTLKPQIVRHDTPAMPEYAQLNDDQLRDRRVLLSEMKELFGDRLTWLAETDARIEVGLSDRRTANESSTSADGAVPLAVRVVVEKRASADSDWQLAWSVDVMSQSEEFVEFAPAIDDGTSMTLWAYALPDGMVAVDSELSFSNSDAGNTTAPFSETSAFQAAFSHVQRDRLPSEDLLTGSDGVEYRVFQTVAVLDKKVG